jgi:hypothetical protein
MYAYANRDGQYKQSCSISGVEGYKLNGLRNLAAAKGRGAARMTVASENMREQWRQIREPKSIQDRLEYRSPKVEARDLEVGVEHVLVPVALLVQVPGSTCTSALLPPQRWHHDESQIKEKNV